MNYLDKEFREIMDLKTPLQTICLFTSDGVPECNLPFDKTCMNNIIVKDGLCLFNGRLNNER